MWLHAGRRPPTLRVGAIPQGTQVLTVQGESDAIVSLDEVRRLHEGSSGAQCRLLVVHGEDHFLRFTATSGAIEASARGMLELK